MRFSGAGRIVLGWTVVGVVLALSLYLWSPWHKHTVQGKKACAFLQVEQSFGLEAGAAILPAPPAAILACLPVKSLLIRGFDRWHQYDWRAPPAV